MEYVDILDELGNLTGEKISKKEAHKIGLWHRSVWIYILNSNNEILLQKRADSKDAFPGVWDLSVAGHVSAGETYEEAAVREISEEIGIEVNPSKLKLIDTIKDVWQMDGIDNKEYTNIYFVELDIRVGDLILQVEEVSEAKFISIDEFDKLVKNRDESLIPSYEEFEKFIAYCNKVGLS
ncbi:MAG: NUDIX domain-containing protein [Clostridia bacterium]|jgi:isopentenyl-diphosphate delta-isomerase type 1|nr:NUDIX domain-containing protein [Clostridia bacterium]